MPSSFSVPRVTAQSPVVKKITTAVALRAAAVLAFFVIGEHSLLAQTVNYTTPYTITTLAGKAGLVGSNNGTGSNARFSLPEGLAVDGSGNVYVADTQSDTIRKITPAGVVTTLAGGNYGNIDGTGSAAGFQDPGGVAVDSNGNVYVADTDDNTIRKITPGGVVTTLAGNPGVPGHQDGAGSAAEFQQPTGVAVDSNFNVYVADRDNNTIRKITPGGVVTTLAGSATASNSCFLLNGAGSAARFCQPTSVAVDASGNVYVADSSNIVIREITPSGVVTIFAGNPEGGGTGCLYCDGSAAMAIFGDPVGVTVDGNGNVYVADYGGNTIRLISDGVVSTLAGNINVPGSTDGTGIGATFDDPESVAVTPSGSIYVADTANSTIREGTPAAPVTSALRFVPVAPCRVLDTRNASGPFGGPTITGGTSRNFTIPSGSCNIPSTAAAYSLNVAVVPTGPLGYLTLWPAGETQPLVATVSSVDGRVRSNAAIVPAGASGAVSVFASNTTDVVLDIDGYFVLATDSTALEFFRMTPCRLVDTRNPNGELGGPFLAGGATRLFLLAQSSCNLPGTARVYSLNVTAIPREPLGYLTAWAGGQAQPPTATLSAVTGTVTANAALVEAGADVTINVYASNDTDLVVDVDGYFAPAGTGGLSFYTLSPCRTLDTRQNAVGPLAATFDASVIWSGCGVPVSAQAYVFNATVVPPAPLGYLTLWPPGTSQPNAAALSALDGTVTSNMAVTPGASGSVDAFPSNPTQLILDIFGCFAP